MIADNDNKKMRRRMPVWLSASLAVLVAVGVAAWSWENEGGRHLVFSGLVTTAIFATLAALTRRPLASALAIASLLATVVLIARLKRSAEAIVLHAWDIVRAIASPADTFQAMREWPLGWAAGAGAVVASVGLVALVIRFERPFVSRWIGFGLVALCAPGIAWTAGRLPERGHTQYFWDGLYVSAFYRSFGETVEALARGGLIEASAATQPAGAPTTPGQVCAPAARAPHILLIHEESVTPPSIFPDLAYDKALDPFFRSGDGQLRHMRVETYGGASWLTEFSVLTGVSSRAFGSMANFVQPFMSGRLRETVPQILAGCGYRTVMFTPWRKQFMGADRFYESIGFHEILDQKAQGNARENERDRFFFANMLNEIGRNVGRSRKPLFAFVETMSAHWPYDEVYEPQVDVPGGGPGTHPEVHEYLRRLAMVKMDEEWLRAELKRRFPGEAFLIVRYGDHHPMATRTLIGLPEDIAAEDVKLPEESLGYITFYAVDGIGYAPPPPPDFGVIDAAYLGGVLLQAARASLPASWKERMDLMRACEGRYWTCPDHARVLAFQGRLVGSELARVR